MTSKGKKIFIGLTVILPLVIYSVIYYQEKFRYANFKAKDFLSLEYKWGVGTHLENSYNSATGEYKYLNDKDSLIIKHIELTAKDKKFLDSNADLQGFWNLPDIVANNERDLKNPNILRYIIKFNYRKESKEVTYFPNFEGNIKMKNAAALMQKVIEQQLVDAEERGRN